jgi:putative sterol carrier protein
MWRERVPRYTPWCMDCSSSLTEVLMSAEDVRAVFEQIGERGFEAELAGVRGSYRFDLRGVGSFVLSVDAGRLAVSRSARDADCIVTCDEQDFLRMARGEQNLVTAVLQGLVEVHGDLSLAQRLYWIFPIDRQAANLEAQP